MAGSGPARLISLSFQLAHASVAQVNESRKPKTVVRVFPCSLCEDRVRVGAAASIGASRCTLKNQTPGRSSWRPSACEADVLACFQLDAF